MISPQIILVFLGASLVPLAGVIATMRRLSGKIGTSEAASLWQESASIREDYRARLATSEERITQLEIRLANEEKVNTDLMRENIELVKTISSYIGVINELRARIEKLEQENSELRDTIVKLGGGKP